MAQAPAPGTGTQKESFSAARTTVTITIRGEEHTIAPLNLPLQEVLVFRKATGGLSIESFWNGETAIGIDSVKVLWWLARRASGEFGLTLERTWAEWPEDLDPSEIDVQVNEPGGSDHPEA